MVHIMPKKIKLYAKGDCVEVNTWEVTCEDGFFRPGRAIGLVLEAELVEMDTEDAHHDGMEWMYRVILPDGRVTECWDYEVRPVNVLPTEYNNISHKAK
tara:strand:- start:462 stop:758 length:297 start_codon:yes stop_codon:yes gene_type:complete